MKYFRTLFLVLLIALGTCGLLHTNAASGHLASVPLEIQSQNPKLVCTHRNLGQRYSEALHPHEYYSACLDCGEKVYHGQCAVKNHGTGEWGSGTCPDCGTHTYTGRTCTAQGVCACGDTVAAYGHSYGASELLCETKHPHKEYTKCTRCGHKNYTGNSKTLPHGDGSSGTCQDCGDHHYTIVSMNPTIHPHEAKHLCACGSTHTSYSLRLGCGTCMGGETTVYGTTESASAMSLDISPDSLAPIIGTITVHIEYSNTFNNPYQNSLPGNYGFPKFASWGSYVQVSCKTTGGVSAEPFKCFGVNYYDASGTKLATQTMAGDTLPGKSTAAAPIPFVLDQIPAYVTVLGTAQAIGGTSVASRTLVVEFP